MAAKKPTAPAIDPAATYRVRLAKTVRHGPTWLRPNARVTLSGTALAELKDAIASFEAIS
jgi:hypothetical protein